MVSELYFTDTPAVISASSDTHKPFPSRGYRHSSNDYCELFPEFSPDRRLRHFLLKGVRLWGPVGLRADFRGRTLPNFYGSSLTWFEMTGGFNIIWGER